MTSKISTIKNSILIATLALLPLAAVEASAQKKVITVDVPFAFVANHTSLPAGHYQVIGDGSFLTFSNADTGEFQAVVMSMAQPDYRLQGNSKLKFYVSGNRHLLTEVEFGGSGISNRLMRQPKPERVVAGNTPPAARTIEIATR